jgi:hypothetical protein
MANMPGIENEVSGKKLIPQLAIGCLLFAALMGFGTVLFAKMTTPYFEKLSRDSRAKLEHDQAQGHKP